MRSFTVVERALIGALVVAALVVVAFLVLWHLQWRRVLRVIAEHPPRADIAALMQDLPEPPELSATADAAVAAEAEAWFGHVVVRETGLPQDDPWLLGVPGMGPNPDTLARVDAEAATLRELRELLRHGYRAAPPGPLVPGVCPADPQSVTAGKVLVPAAACWQAMARRDADPGPALDALDALVAARSFPDDSDDLGWFEIIGDHRDQAYLVADILGRVPAGRLERWRAEPEDAAARFLVSLEHLRSAGCPGAFSSAVANLPSFDLRSPRSWGSTWSLWWRYPALLTEDMEVFGHLEDAVLARAPWAGPDARRQGEMFRYMRYPFAHDFRHRLAVLATRVLDQREAGGGVPDEPAGLDLAGGRERLALQYRKVGPRAFAIVADDRQAPFVAACLAADPPRPPNLGAGAVNALSPTAVVVVLP